MGSASSINPDRYEYSLSTNDEDSMDYAESSQRRRKSSRDMAHQVIGDVRIPVRSTHLGVPIVKRHPFTDYRMSKKLGEGAYSFVFKGIPLNKAKDGNEKVAIKEVNLLHLGEVALNDLQNEMNILSQLQHTSIVRLHKVYMLPDKIFLIMEYLRGGELLNAICKRDHYTENDARRVFSQLISALSYLHARRVIHRDLKPENLILADRSFTSDIKLVDFGFSIVLDSDSSSVVTNLHCGTPGYMAPEIINNTSYSTSVDMWSSGVVLYILLSGLMPFNAKCSDLVVSGSFTFPEPYWSTVSDNSKDLIRKLLEVDPMKRLTADQALMHPWLTTTSTPPLATPTPSPITSSRLIDEVGNSIGTSDSNDRGFRDLPPSDVSDALSVSIFKGVSQNTISPSANIGSGNGSGNRMLGQTPPLDGAATIDGSTPALAGSQINRVDAALAATGDLTRNLVEIRRYNALRKFRLSALVLKGASKFKGNLKAEKQRRKSAGVDISNEFNVQTRNFSKVGDGNIVSEARSYDSISNIHEHAARLNLPDNHDKHLTLEDTDSSLNDSITGSASSQRPRSISTPDFTKDVPLEGLTMATVLKDRFYGSESDNEQ